MSDAKTQQGERKLFPLDAQRVIVLPLDGVRYTHIFRPMTGAEARAFFNEYAVALSLARAGREADLDRPQRELYALLCVRVEGYKVKGGGDAMALPNWQERIPLSHRLLALEKMTAVELHRGEQFEIDPEFDATVLDALGWTGLVHRFEPVSAEDRHEFRRDAAKTKVVGGSRNGATIFPAEQNILLRIYDRKIREVGGYSLDGRAFDAASADDVALMDPFHKVAALQPLFQRVVVEDRTPEESAGLATQALKELEANDD